MSLVADLLSPEDEATYRTQQLLCLEKLRSSLKILRSGTTQRYRGLNVKLLQGDNVLGDDDRAKMESRRDRAYRSLETAPSRQLTDYSKE